MANRVYALLVGINDYGPGIESLDGCLNDVELLHGVLRRHVDPATLAVERLTNGDASRANVIARFRSHLGQAQAGDVALFQFCGHGARWASSVAFREAFPDGRDEGLVCADSRQPGGYDLADKELAVLIGEVAATGAETVVILDSCHSGSATRAIEARPRLKPRLTHEITTERPLETYLDGWYARRHAAGDSLFVPAGRHILLAACERGQLAQEAGDHGLFTGALVEVLEAAGGAISYADLFVRCRAAVRARAFDQDPQFETYGRFDAGAGFLGRPAGEPRGRYLAFCDQGVWTVECGAIGGVPDAPGAAVTLTLYPEADPSTPAGTAEAIGVGPQRSEIALAFESRESDRYLAEITSLPAAPAPIAFRGDAEARAAVEAGLARRGVRGALLDAAAAADWSLAAADGRLTLTARDRDRVVGFAEAGPGGSAGAAAALAPAVRHVLQWQRLLTLRPPRTALDLGAIDVAYVERLAAGGERSHDGPAVSLTFARAGGAGAPIRGRLRVRHRLGQPLALALLYASDAFGMHVLANEPSVPPDTWVTLWGDGPQDTFYLEDGVDRSEERFRLVVSTEKVDDFRLALPALTLGERYGGDRGGDPVEASRPLVLANAWGTLDLRVHVGREGTAA